MQVTWIISNLDREESLTQETVLGWVWASVDKEATEAALAKKINDLKNPPVSTGLPW